LITLSGGSTQTINSLLSNDRLTVNNSTLVVGTTAQINNTLTLTSNGTLRGGVYTIAGGSSLLISGGNILNGVTVNGAVDMASVNGAQLDVLNGLTLNGTMTIGKADGSSYGQLYFGDSGVAAGMVAGTGTVVFGGYGNTNSISNYSDLAGADATLTIGSGITIRGKTAQIVNRTSAGTIVNQGTISADVAGGAISVGGTGTFVNQGTLSALNGGTLNLNGAWSGTGTLSLGASSTLNLGGAFTQAGMGTLNRSGGTVNLNGTLTGNLALGAGTGSWILNNGTIRNGMLSTNGSAALVVSTGTLDGVSVNGTIDMASVNGAQLDVHNGLSLAGAMSLGSVDGARYGQVYFGEDGYAAGTLSGSGTITLGGYGSTNTVYNYSNQIGAAGTLTIGSGVTIHGKSGQIVNRLASNTIVNQGTISAVVSGGGVSIGGTGTFLNQGTVSVLNGDTLNLNGAWSSTGTVMVGGTGSTLNLGGNVTQAGLGMLSRTGGNVNLTGTLAGNLALDAASGSWKLASGTVRNGVYSASGGSSLVISSGTFDGMTANSDLDLASVNGASLSVFNGLTLTSTMSLGKVDGTTYGQIYFGDSNAASGALTGTGTVLMGGYGNNNTIYNYSNQLGAGGTLTIGSGITIHGKNGQIINRLESNTIVNQGTISADVSGGTINIGSGTGTFINQGTLSAINTATLAVRGAWTNNAGANVTATGSTLNLGTSGSAWSNAGTITATNSTVNLDGNFTQASLGSFNRTGGTVTLIGTVTGNLGLDAATGSWSVNGGKVRNGTLTTTGGSSLNVSDGTLDGVVISNGSAVNVTDANGANLSVLNGLVFNGSMAIGKADGSRYGQLYFGKSGAAAGALTGTGTLVFGTYGNNNTIYNYSDQLGATSTLTIGSGITIHGHSGRIINNYGSGTIVNQGTISADVSGGTINIGSGTGSFVNQGTLSALNGGTLNVAGNWSNVSGANITATASTLGLGSSGYTWSNAGSITATNSTVNLDGNFSQAGLGTFTRSGGTVNLNGVVTGDLSLDAASGSWNLTGGQLRNGALSTTGGAALQVSSGTFSSMSVTPGSTVNVTGTNGASLNMVNGLTLNGTINVGKADGSWYGQVYFGAAGATAGALTGSGAIVLGPYGSNNTIYNYSDQLGSAGTLTIGSGITIHGHSGRIINNYATGAIVNQGIIAADVSGGTINVGNDTGTFTSQGTLSAQNGGTLTLGGTWSSTGTISLAAASTLNLEGRFTQAGMGTFNRSGGTVNLKGILTGNLALDAGTGSWNLTNSGDVKNGVYSATGGSALVVSNGVFDGMTANGPLDLATVNGASLVVYNGLALNNTLSLGRADGTGYGELDFASAGHAAGALTGSGMIVLGSYGSNNTIYNASDQIGATGTLTIGNGITIHGHSGRIINYYGTGTIVNQGTISADVSGGTIAFGNGTGTVVNQGTLSALNGGTLTITGPWSNTGTITENNSALNLGGPITTAQLGLAGFSRTGGTVNLSGALDNTGATLTLDAVRGSWGLTNGGSITGGTVALTGGSRLLVGNGALSNVVVNGDIDVNNSGLSFNNLTLNGTARVGSNFNPVGNQTLSGAATLLFQGNGSVAIPSGYKLTLPAAVAVRGGNGNFSGGGTLLNQGLISADTPSTTITLSPGTLTNVPGAIIEAAGGNLTISGSTHFTNNGILRASSGTLSVGSSVILNNTATSSVVINGGTMSFDSAATSPSLDLSVGTLAGSGNFSTPTFNWTGGTMSGNGRTVVASGAVLNISGTGAKSLSRTIDNSGTTSWTDGQVLLSSGTFNNLANGVFTVTAANSFFNSGGANLFSNTGALAKNSSSVTIFGVPFTNQAAGVVNVNDGTLVLSGGGTNFGTINIAAGATARFGGNFTHAAGSTLMGAGNIDFNTTTVTLNGNLIIDGELSFNSASATVKAGATVSKLSLTGSSATVAAGGVLSVGAGGVNFGGSTNNTVTLQPSATTPGKLALTGNVNFTGTAGTAALNTADFVAGQSPGLLDLSGATRTFSINDGLAAIDMALSARIMNGAVTKSGAGTLRLDSPNPFTGGVTVSAGTLEAIDPAALGTGNVTIGDATLSLKSDLASPVTFGNNVNVTGDATINVDRISVGTSGIYKLGAASVGATRLSVTGANRSLELASLNLTGSATLDTSVPLAINGPITQSGAGMGFTKSTGTAKLTLGGATANTYTGLTRINAGAVELNKPANVVAVGGNLQVFGGSVKLLADGQIADTAAVAIANSGSLLDFAGHSDTFGAMMITGNASATVGVTASPTSLGTAVLRMTSLAITTGGQLDLGNNALIVDDNGSTPVTSVRDMITSAYAAGAWNGKGLASSPAASSPRALGYARASDILSPTGGQFVGQDVSGNSILVRYTLAGDANLDGVVNFNDLVKLAQNYNIADGARTWIGGDFNYDGNTDFNDLVKLAQNYNLALPGGAIPGALAGFQADLAAAFASVPEPSALALLALGAMGMLRRNRNRR
jgi:hypothetical protein